MSSHKVPSRHAAFTPAGNSADRVQRRNASASTTQFGMRCSRSITKVCLEEAGTAGLGDVVAVSTDVSVALRSPSPKNQLPSPCTPPPFTQMRLYVDPTARFV